jgi:tetratricopeptide (TPR) repeat protein
MNPFFHTGFSISDSLKSVRKSVLNYETIILTITEYGQLINEGLDYYKVGNYDASAKAWEKVLKLNGNYDLAYIGIGRALLRQDEYKEAMSYFKTKHDDVNYSKAFKLYRKEWIEDNIGIIFIIIVAVLATVIVVNTVKRIRKEGMEE